jgi:hypothetical protein
MLTDPTIIRPPSHVSKIRQNILRALEVHSMVIEFLKGNQFLLEGIIKRTPENKLFLNLFSECFNLLKVMCFNNNIANKKELFRKKDCFISYLKYIEMGQTELLIEIYKNHYKTLQMMDDHIIRLVLEKVVPKRELYFEMDNVMEEVTKPD